MIVKPEALSQGKGIFITNKIDTINLNEHLIVQEYKTKPYLIDGYKFDLRIYVLVTSWNPFKIFIYKEGMARFATEKYENKNETYQNTFMHLTNYAINKLSGKFKVSDDFNSDSGHKRMQSVVFNRMK